VVRGLQQVRLPGRFQVTQARAEWILDVAHNPAAAHELAAQLATRPASGRTIAVCGILGDKDIESIIAELRDSFEEWVVAGLVSPRAVEVHEFAQRLRDRGVNVSAVAPGVVEACEIADARAVAGDRVVVFGSFLTVGPALQWIEKGQVSSH